MNEEPKTIFGVAVELEEMISAAERSEMARGEAFARAFERVRRKVWRQHGIGHIHAATPMRRLARRNCSFERLEEILECFAAERPGLDADPDSGHPAAEIAAERAGNERALGNEYSSDGHPLGQVSIGHRRDMLDHIGLARESLQLSNRFGRGGTGP
jgi:hypothetical protein